MPRSTRPAPPVIDGVRRSVIRARGIDFHVTESGSEDGVPVLALHGWPQHHYEWRDLLADPPAGLRIIAPDLPGYGWSGPPPHRWFKEEIVSDVLALLDTMGLERVLLVGHDWGGYVGHLLALRAPERFSAYLSLNIPHPWISDKQLLPHLWRFYYQPLIGFFGVPIQTRTGLLFWILRKQAVSKYAGVSDEDLRWYTDRFRDPVCAQAGADTYRTFVTKELPALRRTPETRRSHVPTRAVFGIADVAIHWSLASAKTANADDYTLELIPDTGHFISDERPDIVRDRLVQLAAEFPPV